jgi:hypothetical protein
MDGVRLGWKSAAATLLLVAAFGASAADAQIIRRPTRVAEPRWYVTFIGGYTTSRTVSDGTTDSDWAFGSGPQYGAALEKTVAPGSTFGVSALFAEAPLSYRPIGTGPANCPNACEATANVTQISGVFRASYGGAFAFRASHEFGIGVVAYSNFRDQTTGGALPPAGTDVDFLLSYGSLFGFSLSPSSALEVGVGTGFTIHQREGLAASENTLNPIFGVKVGLRLGLGR